jgi:hypothetical protein
MPERINSPPIVGVPALLMMCDFGPSARIGWPLPCSNRSRPMMDGPNKKTKNSAVMTAPPVRNVM